MSKRDLADNVAEAFRLCNEQQARLDAIAAIMVHLIPNRAELDGILVLARGTPAREVRAALKKYGRKAK
jgi:hypothetical protein